MTWIRFALVLLLAALTLRAEAEGQTPLPKGETEVPDIEACISPLSIEEWRERGPVPAEATPPIQVGESWCTVLKRHGAFVQLIVTKDGPPGAPFEIGLCYPAAAERFVDCAIFRDDDGELHVHHVDRRPAGVSGRK